MSIKAMCELCGGRHPTSEHSEPFVGSPDSAQETSGEEVSFDSIKREALPVLESAVNQDGRDVETIIQELDAANEARDYEAERPLVEALRQRLDIARVRGEISPQVILDALKRSYRSDDYSQVLQDELIRTIPKDNADALVETLMDSRFDRSSRLLDSLDESVQENVYGALKERDAAEKLVHLVSLTQDIGVKLRLFEDLAMWLAQNTSKEAQKVVESRGSFTDLKKRISFDLLKEGRGTFCEFLERGLLETRGLEDTLKDESDESLLDILAHTRTVTDASVVLKFIRSGENLLTAAQAFEHVDAPEEIRRVVIDRSKRLADAFEQPPRILVLDYLRERPEGMSSWDIPNKFVVVLPDGEHQATIAWSSTEMYKLHKDLAKRTGSFPDELCAGGEIEIMTLEDGKTRAVFKGRSGDYGPYNQAFMEQFKDVISQQLEREFGNSVEVVIESSEIGF